MKPEIAWIFKSKKDGRYVYHEISTNKDGNRSFSFTKFEKNAHPFFASGSSTDPSEAERAFGIVLDQWNSKRSPSRRYYRHDFERIQTSIQLY